MWMSLGALIIIALLVLANMMLAHHLGDKSLRNRELRDKHEDVELKLHDANATIREQEKLLLVKERLIENLRRVDEVRKQP